MFLLWLKLTGLVGFGPETRLAMVIDPPQIPSTPTVRLYRIIDGLSNDA